MERRRRSDVDHAVASFYFALAHGAMTVVAPITAVVSAVVPVAVGMATGERPAPVALIGVAVALVAVALDQRRDETC